MPSSRPGLWLRRLAHPIYRRLETDVHPLRYLFLEITQRCNLNCLHCGSDCGASPQAAELSIKEWLRFFDHLEDNFDADKLIAVLTGGVPLCHPRLSELLDGLHSRGLRWGMVTNAWALNQAALDSLIAGGLVSITVSLDGLAENHDWLRGRRGSFERAVSGIQRVVSAGPRLFDVVTCVNPRNLPELPELMALLKNIGVRQWRLFMIFPKGRAKNNFELLLSDDQVRKLTAWIASARKESRGEGFSLDFSCEGFFPVQVDKAIRDEPYFCRAGICIGSVLADGAISACPNISRELCQGNIRTDDFKTVWEQKFLAFRDRTWMKRGPCESCRYWKRCQGNSMHLFDPELGHTARCFAGLYDHRT